jgi:oligopeptide/dipeptide ABC transporter ATP-binding protein
MCLRLATAPPARSCDAEMSDLLTVRDLRKTFAGQRSSRGLHRQEEARRIVALDGVSLTVSAREVVGLVGESGSGKTTLARCLVRLVDADSGVALFDGQDIFRAGGSQLRGIRRRMQLIYQDPYSSLNPRYRVGDAIGEPARSHGLVRDRAGEASLVAELLEAVGLSRNDARRLPRELSGGQRQRVAIARALAVQPELLVADECVSALDVSVQAQILNLFGRLSRERELAMIFISHQLAVIAQIAQRVAIMYLGRIVEMGDTGDVFVSPRHPYTALLLAAHPSVDVPGPRRSPAFTGEIPTPDNIPNGCRFRSRCPYAEPICADVDPPPVDVGNGHVSWCHVVPTQSSAPRAPTGGVDEGVGAAEA